MSATDPSSASFFEAKYEAETDPWGFETSPYELARYDTIAHHVNPAQHHRAFEPGCSIGVLTERLGQRCTTVDATDLSAHAVQQARRRCQHLPGVNICVGGLQPPGDDYDLIVLSEIGYYLDPEQLDQTVRDLTQRITSSGRLIASHWIGTSPDHRLHGNDVHTILGHLLHTWRHSISVVHRDLHKDGFRLDAWDRP